jgi:tRNA threonylcarbamoyl adenosine modification protein YeaZ
MERLGDPALTRQPGRSGLLLALDAGSPVTSVALGEAGSPIAERSVALRRSSAELLAMIRGVLADAGAQLDDLAGLVGLRGPGSFTGLRIGLATLLGLHQALEVPATALSTLEILAHAAGGREPSVLPAVDALRGEWFVQRFSRSPELRREGEPELVSGRELIERRACRVIGFGVETLAEGGAAGEGPVLQEAPPLAASAIRAAALRPIRWQADRLIEPLYLRRPATTPEPSIHLPGAARPPDGRA